MGPRSGGGTDPAAFEVGPRSGGGRGPGVAMRVPAAQTVGVVRRRGVASRAPVAKRAGVARRRERGYRRLGATRLSDPAVVDTISRCCLATIPVVGCHSRLLPRQ